MTGLAWTAVGGEILYIESSYSKGKGHLSLTGNLGEVMKESATLALEYIKSHAKEIGIDEKMFKKTTSTSMFRLELFPKTDLRQGSPWLLH